MVFATLRSVIQATDQDEWQKNLTVQNSFSDFEKYFMVGPTPELCLDRDDHVSSLETMVDQFAQLVAKCDSNFPTRQY